VFFGWSREVVGALGQGFARDRMTALRRGVDKTNLIVAI
jgi:hypothetical protein